VYDNTGQLTSSMCIGLHEVAILPRSPWHRSVPWNRRAVSRRLKRQIRTTHRDRALSLASYITAPSEGIDSATLVCQSIPPYRAIERRPSSVQSPQPLNVAPGTTSKRPPPSTVRLPWTGRARGPAPWAGRSPAERRKEWITTLCRVVRPHLNEQFDGERRVAVTTSLERNTSLTTSVNWSLARRPLTELCRH